MEEIPQALSKEIEECNEQELQQAQTYLLLRMYGMMREMMRLVVVGIVGIFLSLVALLFAVN